MTTFSVGDVVRFAKRPSWLDRLPPESRAVFEFCLGRCYPISEIDQNGLFVLDVSSEVDERFGGRFNDIRVEAAWLEPCDVA